MKKCPDFDEMKNLTDPGSKESPRSRERKYTTNLTDSYVKKKLRRSGIENPTPEQIEQRRELTLARRAKHALKPKLNSCRQCLHCGIFFKFKPGGRNQDGGKYCSAYCQHLANRTPTSDNSKYKPPQTKVKFIECSWCGKLFCSKGGSKSCSNDCRKEMACARSRGISINKKEILSIACKECGKYFLNNYGVKNRTFCSDKCRLKYSRRVSRGNRRARIRGVKVESVDYRKVFEQDGYICQICGCQTSIVFRGSHLPYAPELDHVIPISRGGEHSYKNTQCTCRSCNQLKGSKILCRTQRNANQTL